jgi:hypothetical protein
VVVFNEFLDSVLDVLPGELIVVAAAPDEFATERPEVVAMLAD